MTEHHATGGGQAGRACPLPYAVTRRHNAPADVTPCRRLSGHGGRCKPADAPSAATRVRAAYADGILTVTEARTRLREHFGIPVREDPTMPLSHFELRSDGTVLTRITLPPGEWPLDQIVGWITPEPEWATREAPSTPPRLSEAATGPTIGDRPAGPPEPPIAREPIRHWSHNVIAQIDPYPLVVSPDPYPLVVSPNTMADLLAAGYEPTAPTAPTADEIRASIREAVAAQRLASGAEMHTPAEWERRRNEANARIATREGARP